MAVKIKEKVTADGKKFQKMLEDLNNLRFVSAYNREQVARMALI